jgi:hypothetical protein
MTRHAHTKHRSSAKREGAAMLIVLMVLLMTTATATFAIHSTSTEIRAAGHTRQAVQAEYLAQAGAYAGVGYVEVLKANGALTQYLQTDVAANTASSADEATIDQTTNMLRIPMTDFDGFVGAQAPPVELDAARTPSLGPHNAYQPDFVVDGTDLYEVAREEAGRDLTGRGARYFRMTLTSRAQMAPRNDYRESADLRERSYNEVAMRARAITEVGPFWLGGH